MLTAVGVVLVAVAVAGVLAQGVAARHRAATAADLSALAAADRLLSGHGSGACTAAQAVAAANGGLLARCTVTGSEVVVAVRVASGPANRLLRLPDPVRLARAGPAVESWSR